MTSVGVMAPSSLAPRKPAGARHANRTATANNRWIISELLSVARHPYTTQSGHHFSRTGPLRSRRNLARGERLLRTPGTRACVTNSPRQGRGEILQPLPGCVSLFLFYPGVLFAHPRLSD